MFDNIKKLKENEKLKNSLAIIIAGILGIVFFLFIYGFDKLNVTNENWLLNGGDLSQHYIGWKFFRQSKWNWKIGIMNNINYPYNASIIFTDSIPLFAIIFKAFSKFLPDTFQYFGIYGLITFVFQGIFSYLLVYRFVKSRKYSIITSVFFILSPVIIQREYSHTALASHYIILMALCLWAYNDKLKEKQTLKSVLWILLGILSASIHLYFVPMVMLIMFATFTIDYIKDKKIKVNVIAFIVTCFCILIEIYFLGGFTFDSSIKYGEYGIGKYNSNLNTFFNSLEIKGSLIRELPTFEEQYEGFGYLGCGIIILSIITLYEFLKEKDKKTIISNQYIISGLILCGISIIIATALSFSINQHLILKITFPSKLENIISIFRATGRFIWMACYLIMLMAVVNIYKKYNDKEYIYIFIIVILFIQIYDLRGYIKSKQEKVNNYEKEYVYKLEEKIDMSKYNQIVFLPADNVVGYFNKIYKIANLAIDNKMNINNFYMARNNLKTIDYSKNIVEQLHNNETDEKTIYVFLDKGLLKDIKEKNNSLMFYDIEDYTIGVYNAK